MPRFVVSGLAPDGTFKNTHVEAGNIAAATKILEEQGYREVAVHNSPSELEFDQLASAFAREQREQLTPDQDVQVRHGSGLSVILRRNWFSLLLALTLMGWGLWSGSTWLGGSGILLLLACLFIVIPVMLYAELTRARTWAEWQRVPNMVRVLRFFTLPIHGINVKLDLDVARASALAGSDKLDQALALIEPWKSHPRVTPRVFQGRKVIIFLAARHYDDAIEAAWQAFRAAPDSVESRIEVALLLLQFSDRHEEASSLIEPLTGTSMSTLERAVLQLCQGALAIERGDHERGLGLLEDAKQSLTPVKWAAEAFLSLADGHMALAYAAKGDAALARTHATAALPLLKANGHPLCRRLAGL